MKWLLLNDSRSCILPLPLLLLVIILLFKWSGLQKKCTENTIAELRITKFEVTKLWWCLYCKNMSLPLETVILWPSERNVYLSKAFSVLKNEEKWIGAVAMYKIFRDCGTLLFEIQFLLLQLYYYTKRSWVDVIANEWIAFKCICKWLLFLPFVSWMLEGKK